MVQSVNKIMEIAEKLFELLVILNSPITKFGLFLPVGESLLYCPITKSAFALPVGESLL